MASKARRRKGGPPRRSPIRGPATGRTSPNRVAIPWRHNWRRKSLRDPCVRDMRISRTWRDRPAMPTGINSELIGPGRMRPSSRLSGCAKASSSGAGIDWWRSHSDLALPGGHSAGLRASWEWRQMSRCSSRGSMLLRLASELDRCTRSTMAGAGVCAGCETTTSRTLNTHNVQSCLGGRQ